MLGGSNEYFVARVSQAARAGCQEPGRGTRGSAACAGSRNGAGEPSWNPCEAWVFLRAHQENTSKEKEFGLRGVLF